jgi:hypothetical protein
MLCVRSLVLCVRESPVVLEEPDAVCEELSTVCEELNVAREVQRVVSLMVPVRSVIQRTSQVLRLCTRFPYIPCCPLSTKPDVL